MVLLRREFVRTLMFGSGGAALAAPLATDAGSSTAVKKYAANLPGGSVAVRVSHGLGTTDVQVAVYEIKTGELVQPDVELTSANIVTLRFSQAPRTGQFRTVCVG